MKEENKASNPIAKENIIKLKAQKRLKEVKDKYEKLIKSFATQYFTNRGSLYKPSDDEIEDVIQEVFIKIYKLLLKFPEKEFCGEYLKRTTESVIIDFYRKKRTQVQAIPSSSLLSSIMNGEGEFNFIDIDSLDYQAPPEDHTKELKELFNELKIEHNEILTLYYIEALDYKTIADKIKIPIGTVKSRLSRAKDEFKEKYGDSVFIKNKFRYDNFVEEREKRRKQEFENFLATLKKEGIEHENYKEITIKTASYTKSIIYDPDDKDLKGMNEDEIIKYFSLNAADDDDYEEDDEYEDEFSFLGDEYCNPELEAKEEKHKYYNDWN